MITLRDWPNDRGRDPKPGELELCDVATVAGLLVVRGRFKTGDYFVTVYNRDGYRAWENSCHSTANVARSHDLFDGYRKGVLPQQEDSRRSALRRACPQ